MRPFVLNSNFPSFIHSETRISVPLLASKLGFVPGETQMPFPIKNSVFTLVDEFRGLY
jgi:hypothetical protein